jgi:hypothetical protein
MDLTYVFHEPDGSVHSELDSHLCGLFPTRAWIAGMRDAGFGEVRKVDLTADESRVGQTGFVGVRAPAVLRSRRRS